MGGKAQYNLEERKKLYVSVRGSCKQMQFFVVVSNSSTIQFTKDKEMQIFHNLSPDQLALRPYKHCEIYNSMFE